MAQTHGKRPSRVKQEAPLQPALERFIQSLAEPEPAGGIPDFGVLRQEGQGLAAALKQHGEAETDVTLESVSTDIGVGD